MTMTNLVLFTVLYSQPSITAYKIDTPPSIDGQIETAWLSTEKITGFYQREPETGEPVSKETVVYICYDADNIYVAFKCFDDPDRITAKEMARDAVLANEDKIVVMLDTFLDRRNAFWFEINPRGSKGDALIGQNGAVMNKDWDGIWQGKSAMTSDGWETELAIPFKSLNFSPGRDTWGIKFVRAIMHNNELAYWPAANLDAFKYQVSDAGQITGLTGITQGIGLDVRPYALAGIDQNRGEELEYPADAGLDLYYQVSSGLKGVVTVNTDFAQTEVDDRQINLTRFPLFYPEKRDFFLDGAHYFQFSREADDGNSKSRQLVPFFSRRIGLGESGSPIPIIGGLKLTGQAGPWNLGFLSVVDDRMNGRKNLSAARITRNFGSQSGLGIIGTTGNAVAENKNSIVGADLKLGTSTFKGNKNLMLLLFGVKSYTRNLTGNDWAFGTEVSYPNDLLSMRLGYSQIENNFHAGVGFVPRKNIRNSYGEFALGPRPKKWGILQVQIKTTFDYITDLSNHLKTRELGLSPFIIRFFSADEIRFKITRQYDVIQQSFDIFTDRVIRRGIYDYQRYAAEFLSAKRRNYWMSLEYDWGEFYNGTGEMIKFGGGYKVGVPLYLGISVEYGTAHLPAGDFDIRVARVNGDILLSPSMTILSFIQYDNESEKIGWQSRFRWILKPGNEILFAWNSIWQDPMEQSHPSLSDYKLGESSCRLKINYNYRF